MLKILLSHYRSFEFTPLNGACVVFHCNYYGRFLYCFADKARWDKARYRSKIPICHISLQPFLHVTTPWPTWKRVKHIFALFLHNSEAFQEVPFMHINQRIVVSRHCIRLYRLTTVFSLSRFLCRGLLSWSWWSLSWSFAITASLMSRDHDSSRHWRLARLVNQLALPVGDMQRLCYGN